MNTLDATYRQSPHLAVRRLGHELVAITTDDSRVHELNETAAVLVLACERPTTGRGLVEEMVTRFEVSRAVAEVDVAAFLSTLVDAGLLVKHA
jgi:hypothetical protein